MRSHRLAWRVQGLVEWLLQKVTPRSWWNRRTVPGMIVAATNSELARGIIDDFLELRLRSGLFGVNGIEHFPGSAGSSKERASESLVRCAWTIDVNRGTEKAVLRDLEYFVARAFEQKDGYAGIDPRLSVAIARRRIAAHQARRVIPTRARYQVIPAAPVEFHEPQHADYVKMITRVEISSRIAARRRVTVAILDSAFDPQHVAPGVSVPIELGVLTKEQARHPQLGHGAVTASIIGSLAPTAKIVVYPVLGGIELVSEDDVANSLRKAALHPHADLIVMCLQLPEQNGRSERDFLEYFLEQVVQQAPVVVSSGNSDAAGSLTACYPATHDGVIMVGAVDSRRARAEFSCYDLRGRPHPALYVVAPGGAGSSAAPSEYSVSVGGRGIVGTSVAAAYAAGIVARSLAEAGEIPRPIDLYRMLGEAAVRFDGWDEIQHGMGLVRELA